MIDPFHPAPIPSDVDSQGFVLVAGRRVPNDWKGSQLRAMEHTICTCQRCKDATVRAAVVVAVRIEPSVPGGLQYHHTIAEDIPRLCAPCRGLDAAAEAACVAAFKRLVDLEAEHARVRRAIELAEAVGRGE